MKNKKLICLTILFIALLAVSNVSASEVDNEIAGDVNNIDGTVLAENENMDEIISDVSDAETDEEPMNKQSLTEDSLVDENEEKLAAGNVNNFTQLQTLIDQTPEGGVLDLTKDYYLNSISYLNGTKRVTITEHCLIINKNITINGNGHSLVVLNHTNSNILNITNDNTRYFRTVILIFCWCHICIKSKS